MKKNVSPQTIINVVAKTPGATASTLNSYFQMYGLGEPDDFQIAQFEALQIVNAFRS